MSNELGSKIADVVRGYLMGSHGLEPEKEYDFFFRLFREAWEENDSVVGINWFADLLKEELDEKLLEQNESKFASVTDTWLAWEHAFKELGVERSLVGSSRLLRP